MEDLVVETTPNLPSIGELSPAMMGGMGAIVLGFLLSAIFAIILIVKAFKTSPVWGVCSIFVPFALLVFVIKFWGEAGGSFIKYLASSVLAGAGAGVV
ncbi:MAG: hypothetical protein AAF191_15480, partial [Verrucomicrobiota bacterium]